MRAWFWTVCALIAVVGWSIIETLYWVARVTF